MARARGGGHRLWQNLTISRSPDGNLHAEMRDDMNPRNRRISQPAPPGEERHRFVFGDDGGPVRYVCNFDAPARRITGFFVIHGTRIPLNFNYVGPVDEAEPARPDSNVASALDDVNHAIDVHISDRLVSAQKFNIMEDTQFQQAVPPTPGAPGAGYNLAKPELIQECQKAGINFVLLTTLEEFQDQDVDLGRSATQSVTSSGQQLIRRPQGAQGPVIRNNNSRIEVRGNGVTVQKEQIVRLTVRCRLADCATGNLLLSATHNYNGARTYQAVARGQNEVATSDFIQTAAANIANWTADQVTDAIFPIKVLKIKDDEIVINRGTEDGLQTAQTFDVIVQGEVLRDPTTHEPVETEENIVARVSITELHPKSSRAHILGENKGVVVGAICRRVGAK